MPRRFGRRCSCASLSASANVLIAAAAVFFSGHATGQQSQDTPLCGQPFVTEAARRACIIGSVRSADDLLNSEYARLRDLLREPEVQGLLTTQRAWLRTRDRDCGVNQRVYEREAWLAAVGESPNRAACLIAASERRIVELRRMQRELRSAVLPAEVSAPLAKLAPRQEAASTANLAPDQRTRCTLGHRTGRYYFEVVIDETRGADGNSVVAARVRNGSQAWVAEHRLERRDLVLKPNPTGSIRIVGGALGELRIPKVVIGWAVDLDAGRAYLHRNGTWANDAPPGSARGAELDRAGETFAEVTANEPLQVLLSTAALQVNFGDQPFSAFAPAGYRGFDWPEHLAGAQPAATSAPPRIALEAPPASVASMQRFAEWIKSFPRGESPSADRTGERCGAGQSGAVWFLAGWSQGGVVRRTCAVPQEKAVLVPVMNSIAQAPVDNSCDALQVALRKFSESAEDVHFSLDGTAWEPSRIHQAGTPCFRMRDGATGQPNLAATTGYWVVLPPMAAGDHVIRFGGRFRADGFTQDITYELQVR